MGTPEAIPHEHLKQHYRNTRTNTPGTPETILQEHLKQYYRHLKPYYRNT
jgi:hypothetical protein